MASKFIKIYNDTVLKQTILQGYETQRTNPNLGKIYMGELAFTRDTGRVFVGNYSSDIDDKELPLDTRGINGGILTGNKYIGLIDSKPLGHWSTTGSNGTFPLNYTSTTTDKSTGEKEVGLFMSGSRFRPHKTDEKGKVVYDSNKNPIHKRGGDGWDKSAEYIQEYGVYSGDFAYDVFNNAFILFDKGIKPGQEINRVWDENTKKESILNDKNEDVTKTATRRTKIENHTNSKTKEYPIFGDGYVMMRILEPDGITIDYIDKQFYKGEPHSQIQITDEEQSETFTHLGWPNWNHNVLKVNYPAERIFNEAFDSNSFYLNNNKITAKTDNLSISGTSVSLPNVINFSSGLKLTFKNKTIKNAGYLKVDSNGNVTPEETTKQQYTIQGLDGIMINGESGGNATLDENNPSITIGIAQKDPNSLKLTTNPWDLNEYGTWIYSACNAYTISGTLCSINMYENDYINTKDEKNNNDFANVVEKYWDSTFNDGMNFFKNPYPIQAYNGTLKGLFAISPCITALKTSSGSKTISVTATYDDKATKKEETEIEEYDKEDGTRGETTIKYDLTSYIYNIENYTKDGKISNAGYHRIPKHATSVILEVHHTSNVVVTTASSYSAYTSLDSTRTNLASNLVGTTLEPVALKLPSIPNVTNKVVLTAAGSGIDKVEVPLFTVVEERVQYKDEKGNNVNDEQVTYNKLFQYAVKSSGNVVVNVIGYRV